MKEAVDKCYKLVKKTDKGVIKTKMITLTEHMQFDLAMLG